jgi:hypothetical protein
MKAFLLAATLAVLTLSNANACEPITPAETAAMVAAGWTDLGDGLFATRARGGMITNKSCHGFDIQNPKALIDSLPQVK